jgi:hypothetical protein
MHAMIPFFFVSVRSVLFGAFWWVGKWSFQTGGKGGMWKHECFTISLDGKIGDSC